jgi:hypothetical protein
MISRRLFASVAVAVWCLHGLPARAEDQALKAAAKSKLEEGARSLDSGDYAAALEKFEEAYRLVPSPKIFFNIGLAEVGLARYPDALRAFERFVGEAGNAAPKNLAEARSQIENLRPKVALVDVECATKGVDIVIDGRSYGKTPLDKTIYIDPGQHRLLAQAGEGTSPIVQVFSAAGGTRQGVKVTLLASPAPPPGGPSGGPSTTGNTLVAHGGGQSGPQDRSEDRPFYGRAWFWGVVAGAVVIGAASVFLLAGRSPSYPNPSLGSYPGD